MWKMPLLLLGRILKLALLLRLRLVLVLPFLTCCLVYLRMLRMDESVLEGVV